MFRSQSGPGGLSINVASANATSGAPSLAPPAVGENNTSLFGNSTNTSQPQTASSLFSNTQTQPTGNMPNSSNLFGKTTTTNGGTTGGGLFGAQQSQQRPGGIFGPTSTQAPQPQAGGLFGPALNSTTTQPASTGLFGNILGSQNNASTMGGFSKYTNNQNTPLPETRSIFSTSIGQQNQQQQTVPGVLISVNELRPTTRFNDLHWDLKRVIEHVDNFILSQIKTQEDCAAASEGLDNTSAQIAPDVEFCTKQLKSVQDALENDAQSIAFAKDLVKSDVVDADMSFKAVRNLKLPQQLQHRNLWGASSAPRMPAPERNEDGVSGDASRSIVGYFSNQADDMSRALGDCRRNLAEVETYLRGMEKNVANQISQRNMGEGSENSRNSAEEQVRELAAVLRTFEDGILGVATKVGATRESVQEVMLA